jgi:cytidylate kinase
MSVVTISRQLGSLGGQIGRQAADLLGYQLVWRDLINASARRAGAPATALAMIDELGLLGIRLSAEECQTYRNALKQVMEELVLEGDKVIVGRAGQAVLRGQPDVLHVRVIAPFDLRSARIAQEQHISLEGAQAQVEASDNHRKKYLKRCYQIDWDNPEHYDLLINTARISPTEGARLIAQAVSTLSLPQQAKSNFSM